MVFRRYGYRTTVLLVRSKKDPTIWVFPKGHIDDDESERETAIRETWEEAGVGGILGPAVGAPLEFDSGKEPISVQYFLMRATSELPSPEGRDKLWLTVNEALVTLAFESARQKLREAAALLRFKLR
jgi:diphosphoinositol-polyphosphate diphosphatase